MLGHIWRKLGIGGDAVLSTAVAVAFGIIIGMLIAALFSCQPILCGTPEECAKCSWPGLLDTYDTLIATAFAIVGVAAALAIGIRQEQATLEAMKEAGKNTSLQIREAEREAQRNRGAKVIGKCYQMLHEIHKMMAVVNLRHRYTLTIKDDDFGQTFFYKDIPLMLDALKVPELLDSLEVAEPEFFVILTALQDRCWDQYSEAAQAYKRRQLTIDELPPVFSSCFERQMCTLTKASDHIGAYIQKYGGPRTAATLHGYVARDEHH